VRTHPRGDRALIGSDTLLLERLVSGGFLGALAVVVAFGPELSRAVVRLRQRGAPDRRSIGVEPTPS
jgi:hypothetical protein